MFSPNAPFAGAYTSRQGSTGSSRAAARSDIATGRGGRFGLRGALLTIVDARDRLLRDRGGGHWRSWRPYPGVAAAPLPCRASPPRAVPMARWASSRSTNSAGSALVAAVRALGRRVGGGVRVRAALEAWRGTVSLRTGVILAVAAHAIVLLLPLSRRATSTPTSRTGTSPGCTTRIRTCRRRRTSRTTRSPMLVGPKWFSTPAVYGPLFTGYASIVVRVAHNLETQVQVFRWTAALASLGERPASIAITCSPCLAVARGVRGRGVRTEPGRAVPVGRQRAQRPSSLRSRSPGRSRWCWRARAPARRAALALGTARQGDGRAPAAAAPGVVPRARVRRRDGVHGRS